MHGDMNSLTQCIVKSIGHTEQARRQKTAPDDSRYRILAGTAGAPAVVSQESDFT